MSQIERRQTFVRDSVLEQRIKELCAKFEEQVRKVFVGGDELVEAVLVALFAQTSILLLSTPGKGKSTLARTIGRALALTSSWYQFRADTQPSELLGFLDYQRRDSEGKPFVTLGPIFAEIFIADELNRAPSKVKSPLLASMQEKTATIVGEYEPRKLSEPRLTIATRNPIEGSRSVFQLGAAEIDRFGLELEVPIQSIENREKIIARDAESNLEQVEPVIGREELLAIIHYVRRMASVLMVEGRKNPIINYIARLSYHMQFVSDPKGSHEGASERAQVDLWRIMNAYRVVKGIETITPTHVQKMVKKAWGHRIVAPDDKTARSILEESLKHVPLIPEE